MFVDGGHYNTAECGFDRGDLNDSTCYIQTAQLNTHIWLDMPVVIRAPSTIPIAVMMAETMMRRSTLSILIALVSSSGGILHLTGTDVELIRSVFMALSR